MIVIDLKGQPKEFQAGITPAIFPAVSAALAEELGTDVTAIRILSFKKVS